MEKSIQELQVEATSKQFWGALRIYIEKPHIVNRRLCGISNLWIGELYHEYSFDKLVTKLKDTLKVPEALESSLTKLKDTLKVPEALESSLTPQPKEKEASGNTEAEWEEQVKTIKNILISEGFTDAAKVEGATQVSDEYCEESNSNGCKPLPDIVQENKTTIPWQRLVEEKALKVVVIRKILPRQLQRYPSLLEVIILDSVAQTVGFFPQITSSTQSICPRVHYSFSYIKSAISLQVVKGNQEVEASDPNIIWLQQNVLPKLAKWAAEVEEDGSVEERGSLRLVDVQEYNNLYQKLKIKYGQPLVEKWPEVTDPSKFVFEDIAIATYLILIWQQERQRYQLSEYQTFADLGCGNGLLVYILTGEGYKGIGIDIKKRNIWDMFPENVSLKEGVVEPSDRNLFPEYDWLIGNHSDELTPWLPVIAAKSKFSTRFFVIPCCAHDFDCKYRRRSAGKSQYSEYLDYVKEIGSICGFKLQQDKLRIPSTKRICIIGQERKYDKDEMQKVFKDIDAFIKKRNEANATNTGVQDSSKKDTKLSSGKQVESELWSHNFKVRDAVQPVRNCTKIDQAVKDDIISSVTAMLLEKKHLIEIETVEGSIKLWDRGGSITLGDLARRLGSAQLSALKKECGGLQTLLRNHKHIFSGTNGQVSLQVPSASLMSKVPSDRIKTKLCWFHSNHSQGCPVPATSCTYAHGQEDLKPIVKNT